MAMMSGVRSISKLKHVVSIEALSMLSSSLSHVDRKLTLLDKPLQPVAEGNMCYQNSRSYHFKPRDGGRGLELCKVQWRSYYDDVGFDLDIDGLTDEQITFPEFSAKGELVRWEKAKFISGSALPDPCTPSIGFLNIWEGSGEYFADKGDKVRLEFKCYDMSGHIEHEKLPHDMTLGQGKHGQGFDEGIYGMRSGGRRRIAIPHLLCATSNNKFLKKLAEFWHHPEEYKIFDVILIDIDKVI